MDSSLVKRKDEERKFLEQLLDSSKLEDYKVDVPIQAELRKYQQVCLFGKVIYGIYEGDYPSLRLNFFSTFVLKQRFVVGYQVLFMHT